MAGGGSGSPAPTPSPTPISASGAGSGGAGDYALVKFLSGGTFTTGAASDWRTQFSGAQETAPLSTSSGEVLIPGTQTTYGVLAGYVFDSYNPYDSAVFILEASVGSPVQVYVNGALIDEVDAPGTVDVSFLAGFNTLEIIRAQSPLSFVNSVFGPAGLATWQSFYPQGEDPYN